MHIKVQGPISRDAIHGAYACGPGYIQDFSKSCIGCAQSGIDGAVVAAVIRKREVRIDAGRTGCRGKIIGADGIRS